MQHFNTSRQYAPCNQKAGSRRSLNRVLGPVEDRRRRPHKRTALAKLRDALWGGPFLCPNFCIAWMQKRLLNLALKVSITVLLIEYSSTESATFSPPSQRVVGAIFLTKKTQKYVFIQLSFHLTKGNGTRLLHVTETRNDSARKWASWRSIILSHTATTCVPQCLHPICPTTCVYVCRQWRRLMPHTMEIFMACYSLVKSLGGSLMHLDGMSAD